MDASEDQSTSTNNNNNTTPTTTTTNGNLQTSRTSRPPQIAHMSLYERQAVQALQALQRQPNAAQYFQQLMLQQQINNAQLHNLAAVQQATLAASRQSNTASNSISQATTTVNLNTTSAGGTAVTPRPHGAATSATTTALNQSVLLGGNSPGQGQMYLRVNRSLRAPLASQLIFMPGGTATATVATVAQTQQQQQQQTEAPTSASAQSDSDQVQNLALHCASTPRAVSIKSELSERKEPSAFPLSQQQQVQPQQQAAKSSGNTMAVKGSNQPGMSVPPPAASVAPSASSSPALPLSQLLLSSSAAPVILVPTSNVPTSTQGYSIGSVAPKGNVNTQTLVVQPLQQAAAAAPDKGPVPIQPKTVHGHRLPVQVSPRQPLPILPAPPSGGQPPHNPPHIPVQLVGARQCMAGSVQAVALAQVRSVAAQENVNAASHNTSATVNKSANGSLKRKSDCDAPNETSAGSSESAPIKDAAPAVTPAATKDSATLPAAAFPLPPTLSLPLSRAGHGDKERAPLPQAVVKPQVLTHLIEGFVIQEGAEPFPVAGLLKDRDFALGARAENGPPLLKCEYCSSLAPANKFRGSKRFCSNTCAKRYNVSFSKHYKSSRGRSGNTGPAPLPPATENVARRRGPPRRSSSNGSKLSGQRQNVKCRSDSSRSEDASSDGDEEEEDEEVDTASLSPSSSHSRSCSRAEQDGVPQSDAASAPGSLPMEAAGFLSATPAQWSVEEVCRFISSLQGCEELAAHFLSQEIDGQALLLLREDHLISTMNIKLGPALKICASINSLRE
ncbi:polyhomeotic-like protein 1 isoform X2 [Hippocampus zosterae]|uniref:polyhomeotic-like protein 1 isoform X2 n=1 Tax=Hippocampus zosterae TaxID=109293 RepID=UPI00223E3BE0|nr:polyhomeotic-like protein 1 isoform X2 [Hippocampus zosterae]